MICSLQTLKSVNFPFTGEKVKRALLLCGLLLATLFGYSQNNDNKDQNPQYCLKIKLKPTIEGSSVTGATVKLYRGTEEVFRIDTTQSKETVLYLDRNESYTIEMSAPGRVPRKVAVNTTMPQDFPVDQKFSSVMKIEMQDRMALADDYYVDFPVAIVKFDRDAVKFTHISDYTETLRSRFESGSSEEYKLVKSTPVNEKGELPAQESVAKTTEQ
jgi:hypothetical protein